MLAPWKKNYSKPRQHIKEQRHYLPINVHIVKAMVYPVVTYRCESWTTKKAECWIVYAFELLEMSLDSPSDCKEIKLVNPKGNQSWIFTGRTDAEAEAPILWPLDVKNWLISKDPEAGKDWRQEEKGMTEDGMVGWHDQFNGRVFEQGLGNGEGQGRLACCSPWGHKESEMTEWLNNNSSLQLRILKLCMLDFYNELASLHSESLFNPMGYLSGECALTYSYIFWNIFPK